jgi:hypothetical protein
MDNFTITFFNLSLTGHALSAGERSWMVKALGDEIKGYPSRIFFTLELLECEKEL